MEKLVSLLAVGVLWASSSHAASISYTFSANVSSVWGPSFYGIHPVVGDAISGFFSYDTEAGNFLESPVEKKYFETTPYTFGFTLQGLTLQSDSTFTIDVSKQTLSDGNVVETVQMWDNDEEIKLNGALTAAAGIDLAFTIQNLNPTLDLPNNINSLGFISFQHGTAEALAGSGVTYDITSITVVPEPGVGTLLIGGAVVMWFKRSQTRHEKNSEVT